MPESKNNWIFWVIGIIVIIGLVVLVIFFNQDTKVITKEQQSFLDLYLRTLEPDTEVSIKGSYRLTNKGMEISSGSLARASYTIIEDITINKTEIYCSSYNHYSTMIDKQFTPTEQLKNLSKVDCIVDKIGKIYVKTNKNLAEGENLITLTVSSDGTIKRPTMCVSWTPGVISVNKRIQGLVCENSVWLNYTGTYLDEDSVLKYAWLPANTYRCGENWVEKCESVFATRCNPIEITEPGRFKNKVDKCWRITGELDDSEIEVDLKIKTEGINSLDKVVVYIFDEDLVYNTNTFTYEYLSEFEDKNIGTMEDVVFEIK
jgi:hypothetical protein